MLEKHPLAFKKAAICAFHFLQRSLTPPLMWDSPRLVLGVRVRLFKWRNHLEGTEVFLLLPAPAFFGASRPPTNSRAQSSKAFSKLCFIGIAFFSGNHSVISKVTGLAKAVSVAVSVHSCPRCLSSQGNYSTSKASVYFWHLLKGQFQGTSSRGLKQISVSQNGWLCFCTQCGIFLLELEVIWQWPSLLLRTDKKQPKKQLLVILPED